MQRRARRGHRDNPSISSRLNISIVCDLKASGGAGIACCRISDAVASTENEVCTISCDGKPNQTTCEETLFLGKKQKLFEGLFKSVVARQILDNIRNREWKRQLNILLLKLKPDLINFHNLHSAGLPIDMISTALRHAPVVWTLHDCWSFLGTYYPTHSSSYTLPNLSAINAFWDSENSRKRPHKLSAITPSCWMRHEASASRWKDRLVKTIHNPIPNSFFEYRDRKGCKLALGLDTDKPVVFSIAGSLEEERKGGPILNEILKAKLYSEIQFLLAGSGSIDCYDNPRVKCLGFVRDELTLQIAYHASDLLLHPAPIDNLPNTVAESMSCGTPVIAFDVGGLPEMVIPGKSGWLAPEINAESLVAELHSVLVSKDYENLRGSTKDLARLRFDSRTVGNQYQTHFESLIAAQL